MSKIELGKTYRTRDGREVRIYAVDGGTGNLVHGAYQSSSGYWASAEWYAHSGEFSVWHKDQHLDLIEVKPRIKREVWVNVYRNENGLDVSRPQASKVDADRAGCRDRIACVKLTIDCEEGEGLE